MHSLFHNLCVLCAYVVQIKDTYNQTIKAMTLKTFSLNYLHLLVSSEQPASWQASGWRK